MRQTRAPPRAVGLDPQPRRFAIQVASNMYLDAPIHDRERGGRRGLEIIVTRVDFL
jgi:hypothetical protein